MDVFAVKKGQAKKLTIDYFENMTKKEYPFYRVNDKDKLLLYAVCPECGNPIQIINLFGAEMMQKKTRVVKTHAKHTGSRMNGFAFWCEEDKDNCPLYKPSPLGNEEVRKNDSYSEELKNLIEVKRRAIYKDIRKIVCMNLSIRILDRIYDVFMGSGAYGYKAVNKYNIPYAMLRYQQSISLYGQYIEKSKLGELITEAFNNRSRYFEVTTSGEIKRKVSDYRTVNMIFTKYRKEGNDQFLQLEIYETFDDEHCFTIFKIDLDIEAFIYD